MKFQKNKKIRLLPNFSLFEKLVTLKNIFWVLIFQKMTLSFLCQLISFVGGKFSIIILKTVALLLKFGNQYSEIGCSNYTFTFFGYFWKFIVLKKNDKDQSDWKNCYYLKAFPIISKKSAKISRDTRCLDSLFVKFRDAIFYLFEVLFWQIKQPS